VSVIITHICSYKLQVFNKSNYQSKFYVWLLTHNNIILIHIIFAHLLPKKSRLKVVMPKICEHYFSKHNFTHYIEVITAEGNVLTQCGHSHLQIHQVIP
jgi:hypothetical protein